jgi:nitroreductase
MECSHLVVIAGRKNYNEADLAHFIARVAEVRGTTPEALKGYSDVITGSLVRARSAGFLDTWMAKQSYIALGQFMTAAALLGIDTCPMEGIEPAKFDEILGLTALGYTTLCAAPAGYRAADDKYASQPKVRFKADEVILHV